MIINLEENQQGQKIPREKLEAMIEKNFLTATGRQLAKKTLLATEVTENTEKRI